MSQRGQLSWSRWHELFVPQVVRFRSMEHKNVLRQSLQALFPDKADKITELVDPGEYGMESYFCRVACLFVFSLACLKDLQQALNLAELLYTVPTADETWVYCDNPSWGEREYVKMVHGISEVHLVKFQVSGMPMKWKVITAFVVLAPRLFLWFFFVTMGVHMVMETSTILQLILNSMSLTFIPGLDKGLFFTLTRQTIKHLMRNLEDFTRIKEEELHVECTERVMGWYLKEELGAGWMRRFLKATAMWRLLAVLIVTAIFAYSYYAENCYKAEDGSYISNPLRLPADISFSMWSAIFPSTMREEQEPVWSMPD